MQPKYFPRWVEHCSRKQLKELFSLLAGRFQRHFSLWMSLRRLNISSHFQCHWFRLIKYWRDGVKAGRCVLFGLSVLWHQTSGMLHRRGLYILSLMEAQMLPLPGNPKASYKAGFLQKTLEQLKWDQLRKKLTSQQFRKNNIENQHTSELQKCLY